MKEYSEKDDMNELKNNQISEDPYLREILNNSEKKHFGSSALEPVDIIYKSFFRKTLRNNERRKLEDKIIKSKFSDSSFLEDYNSEEKNFAVMESVRKNERQILSDIAYADNDRKTIFFEGGFYFAT